MKKIFVRNNGFGDNIWTEPIVRHFLSEGEEVLIFTPYPCIFEHYPSSRLYLNNPEKIFPLSEHPIDLRFQEKPKMHYLKAFQEQAGIIDLKLTYPRLHLSEKEKKRKIQKRYAILHLDPYSTKYIFRNSYGIEWSQVVAFIRYLGLEPIQISGIGENLIAPWVKTEDFRQVMSLVYNADLFIGHDSGPSHIAAALEIPSVIFFGSVNPYFRHLDKNKKVFLQSPCPFAHCYHEIPNSLGQPCRLVGLHEAPPCCIHTTDKVIEAIAKVYSEATLNLP
jgi:hypothetical protein